MTVDSTTIDRIVANVLQQLGAGERAARDDKQSARETRPAVVSPGSGVTLDERVITADLLAERVNGAVAIGIGPKAILTPSARDFIRERGLRIDRGARTSGGAANTVAQVAASPSRNTQPANLNQPVLIVVRNTDAVTRLWNDLQSTWTRELVGCPDDAAALAIREVSRGAIKTAVILAEQTHRAACLANRNESVKAVAVRDAGEIALVRRQLRANVWCIDPTPKSWFELRNLLNAVTKT